MLVIVLTRLSR